MKPGRQTAPPYHFPSRFQEESERWRLRYFLSSGFQEIEGGVCTTYRVRMRDGTGEDALFAFLKDALGQQEIPPLIPEAARGRTLRMFREAEGAGLVALEIAHVSRK